MRGTAVAVRDLVLRMIDAHVPRSYLGEVTTAQPVTVTLVGTDMSLGEDENLVLSHAVRKYDYEHRLEKGDTLLLVPAHGGVYVATAVIPVKSGLGGLRANGDDGAAALVAGGYAAGTIDATSAHVTVGGTDYPVIGGTIRVPLAGKTPYHDAEGNPIGQVPLL